MNIDNNLKLFAHFILNRAAQGKTGLIPVFSTQFIAQQETHRFLIDYLTDKYSGFVVYKNNKYPYDNFDDLDKFLKPDTIIIINQITNSFQYDEVFSLAKHNLIIAGFESFCSSNNYLEDFISRFSRISHHDFVETQDIIPGAFFCDYCEENKTIDYTLL